MGVYSDTGPFAIVPEWLLDSGVPPRSIQLYAILGRYADSEGDCWPARKTLAGRMSCSEDTVDRAMKPLVKLGAVVVTERWTEEGDRTSNLYRVCRADPRGARESSGTEGSTRGDPSPRERGSNESHIELDPSNDEEPSSSARDLTRAREGPSTDAWEIAKRARARGDLIVHRVDRVAREAQALLDSGASVEDLTGAVDLMEPHLTVTTGTLGVGMSKYRLLRTREREEAERLDRSSSDLPYVLGKGTGRGSDGVNYDSLR